MTADQRRVLELMRDGVPLQYDPARNEWFQCGKRVPTGRVWKLCQDGLLDVEGEDEVTIFLQPAALALLAEAEA